MGNHEQINWQHYLTDQTHHLEETHHPQNPSLRLDQITSYTSPTDHSLNSSGILNQQQIFARLGEWGTSWHLNESNQIPLTSIKIQHTTEPTSRIRDSDTSQHQLSLDYSNYPQQQEDHPQHPGLFQLSSQHEQPDPPFEVLDPTTQTQLPDLATTTYLSQTVNSNIYDFYTEDPPLAHEDSFSHRPYPQFEILENFSNPQRTTIENSLYLKRQERDLLITASKNNDDDSIKHRMTINAWRDQAQERFQFLYKTTFPFDHDNPLKTLQETVSREIVYCTNLKNEYSEALKAENDDSQETIRREYNLSQALQAELNEYIQAGETHKAKQQIIIDNGQKIQYSLEEVKQEIHRLEAQLQESQAPTEMQQYVDSPQQVVDVQQSPGEIAKQTFLSKGWEFVTENNAWPLQQEWKPLPNAQAFTIGELQELYKKIMERTFVEHAIKKLAEMERNPEMDRAYCKGIRCCLEDGTPSFQMDLQTTDESGNTVTIQRTVNVETYFMQTQEKQLWSNMKFARIKNVSKGEAEKIYISNHLSNLELNNTSITHGLVSSANFSNKGSSSSLGSDVYIGSTALQNKDESDICKDALKNHSKLPKDYEHYKLAKDCNLKIHVYVNGKSIPSKNSSKEVLSLDVYEMDNKIYIVDLINEASQKVFEKFGSYLTNNKQGRDKKGPVFKFTL